MLGGYVGKILWVDLTSEKMEVEHLDEKMARKYLGGHGFAAKILGEKTTLTTEPLSPENPLIFVTGPLTGIVPSSSRYGVAALSPLTNAVGQAHSGGTWADELKRSGFDGIVFTGKAKKPVYLWVNHGEAKILDAGHVWGKDTWEADEILRGETDQRGSVACIGQAGERLVRIACVMNDGRASRAAARCGLGAVMGSKNLKAVVVKGISRAKVNDQQRLSESIKKHLNRVILTPEEAKEEHIAYRQTHWRRGRANIKNWLDGDFDGFLEKLTEVRAAGEPYHCRGCTRSTCSESMMVGGRRRQVYESIVPLGSQCLIDDVEALQEAFDLCNRYGLDSISMGGVTSFAIEAFEKGLISLSDTGGIAMTWGNAKSMVEMVRKVGEREGFGEILGEGVKRAAEHIGGFAAEYAIHVKGLELAGHDPRSNNSMALEYATCNFGPSHMSARAAWLNHYFSELGLSPGQDELLERRFAVEGQAETTSKLQDFVSTINALIICCLLGRERKISHLIEWFNLTTGWDMDLKEFLMIGERIFNLKRAFNVRRGISRKDDTLPARILTKKRGTGGAAESLPFLGLMLSDYYAYRGWSEEGIPRKEKLAELGLTESLESEPVLSARLDRL